MSQRSQFNKRNNPTAGEEEAKPAGMTKKSLSRGKPAREAAAGVRTVSASSASRKKTTAAAPKTKEERRAERRAEREEEDMVASLSNILMKQEEDYLKHRRVWWALLIVGFGTVIISFVLGSIGDSAGANPYDPSTPLGIASVVTLVLAYVFIIGSVVWEFLKIRPIRNACAAKVRSMSPKRRRQLIEAEYEADERRRAEKAAKKAAKKVGK